MREADAWRALLSLHSSTVAATQQIARTADSATGEATLFDERALDSQAREATYCAALTGLASQCDSLLQEAMRLRAMRMARRTVEVQCVNDLVRAHANEVLAVGQSLASAGALEVSATTAELRAAIQNQRSQIAQLRMLASAIAGANELPLSRGTRLVVGVQPPDDTPPKVFPLDDLLEKVYETAREVNETSLAQALERMLAPDALRKDPPESRQFARRSGAGAGAAASGADHRQSAG